MEVLQAFSPIILIFLLLFIFKLSSLKACIIAYFFTIGVVWLTNTFPLDFQQIATATIKGGLVASIAAYVLFFGILLFHLLKKAGAIEEMASFISQTTNNQIVQVLILMTGLSPLVESTSGFGLGFMVIVPILIALGFGRIQSALIGLLSLLAVPWGALAIGTVIGADLVNLPPALLGMGSAVLSLPLFFYFSALGVYIAGGWQALKSNVLLIILFSLTFGCSITFFNLIGAVELAGVLSSLINLVFGLLLIRWSPRRFTNNITMKETAATTVSIQNMFIIMSPYVFLTVLILATRLLEPLQHFLTTTWVIYLPSFSFELPVIYSPGFWLLITCLFTIVVFRLNKQDVMDALKLTAKQWTPFAIITVSFIAIAEIMSDSGMISLLAQALSTSLGSYFMFISPFIGSFGGFLTGSNVGSNAMFINLQTQIATQVNMNPELSAILQNTSSSHATMASPARISLAAAICGIANETPLISKMSMILFGTILILLVTLLFFPSWS